MLHQNDPQNLQNVAFQDFTEETVPEGELGSLAEGQAFPARDNIKMNDIVFIRERRAANLWTIHVCDFPFVRARKTPQGQVERDIGEQLLEALELGMRYELG